MNTETTVALERPMPAEQLGNGKQKNDPEFDRLMSQPRTTTGIFLDPGQFEHAQRVAGLLVTSNLVPEHFRGKQNLGNAVIAVDMAFRMKLNPLMVMQQLYVVHGKPGLQAQFVIAVINSSGQFSRLKFTFTGEGSNRGCVVSARDLKTGERLDGTKVDMELARREGWISKNGSKWLSMPDQMLAYRAASFWSRLFAPEYSMGLSTVEELEDIGLTGRPAPIPFPDSPLIDAPPMEPQPEKQQASEEKPAEPAQKGNTQAPTIHTVQQTLAETVTAAGFSFSQFQDYLQRSQAMPDPFAFPEFGALPTDLCKKLNRDPQKLVETMEKTLGVA